MNAQTLSPLAPTLPTPEALDAAWRRIKEERPTARTLDVARELGVSELTLLLSRRGESVTLLRNDVDAILPRLGELGEVMALTRNPSCVIEKHGIWAPYSRPSQHVGLVLDAGLDLRLFLGAWRHVVAARVDNPRGALESIQWFDAAGQAVHKIFARTPQAIAAHAQLVSDFAEAPTTPSPRALPFPTAVPESRDAPAAFDGEAFRAGWLGLKDTHDFFPLLRKHGLGRLRALEEAPEGHARQLGLDAIHTVLNAARDGALPIMVFVGNDGCIEIHSGPIQRVMPLGAWLNVLDPEFNLHLRTDAITSIWHVEKPTEDGIVTSIEAFDADHRLIVQLFGARKPGKPELAGWRELVKGLA